LGKWSLSKFQEKESVWAAAAVLARPNRISSRDRRKRVILIPPGLAMLGLGGLRGGDAIIGPRRGKDRPVGFVARGAGLPGRRVSCARLIVIPQAAAPACSARARPSDPSRGGRNSPSKAATFVWGAAAMMALATCAKK
jgi:hypothetical protein